MGTGSRKGRARRTPEGRILDDVLDALAWHGFAPRRRNVLKLPLHRDGKTVWVRAGKEGEADVTSTVPVLGTQCDVEVKVPGERPRPEQYERLHELNRQGAIGIWTDSAAWLREVLPHLKRGAKADIGRDGQVEIYYPRDASPAARVCWALDLSEERYRALLQESRP